MQTTKPFQFLMVRLKDRGSYRVIGSFQFQFLMVRLKEKYEEIRTEFENVSIPYGSIKSRALAATTREVTGFQFLMVRLKDSADPTALYNDQCFNSLWFD